MTISVNNAKVRTKSEKDELQHEGGMLGMLEAYDKRKRHKDKGARDGPVGP
jgi:hypothetical protein